MAMAAIGVICSESNAYHPIWSQNVREGRVGFTVPIHDMEHQQTMPLSKGIWCDTVDIIVLVFLIYNILIML